MRLNVHTVTSISMEDLVSSTESLWNMRIPKPMDHDFIERVAENLSKLPAICAYIKRLYVILANDVRERKAAGDVEGAAMNINKRDYVGILADAVKMHYEATSRMITLRNIMQEEI